MKSMENKTLEELDNLENDYIARHWDTRGRHESDMELNDIAVPVEDEELRRLLILLNDRQAQNYSSIMERIFNRASEIGGVVLMWV